MQKKIFAVTRVICLITFFDIVTVASAETIDIDGPWLWMIAPVLFIHEGGKDSIDFDSLSEASSGRVTEQMIANEGANVGDFVGDYQWTPRKISVERPGLIDLAGDGNINDTLKQIGFIKGNLDRATSYALINIESEIAQEATMKVGSDDAIKIWLNGVVVHTNAVNRSSKGYDDVFEVNLNEGKNLLMVKVSEKERKWRMFVGLDVSDTNFITFTLPENLDIDTKNAVDAGGEAPVDEKPFRNSFEYHGWGLPKEVFTDVAVTEKATYFVWKPNIPGPEPGVASRISYSIPYKSIMTLYIPGTIADYETATGLYNNNGLPSKYPYFIVPLPTKTPEEDVEEAHKIFTWWEVIKSFFTRAINTIWNEGIDMVIEGLSSLSPKLRFLKVFLEAGKVIYATIQETLENYRAEKSALDLITIGLQNPSITAEDYSRFMMDSQFVMENNSGEARYLVMVPQQLRELTMKVETYYYRQAVSKSPMRLILRKDTGTVLSLGEGDMHLFWSEDGGGKILLNVPHGSMSLLESFGALVDSVFAENLSTGKKWTDITLIELLEFWADGHGQTSNHDPYWDTWNEEWKGNDNLISDEHKAYITKRLLGTLKMCENLTLGNIVLNDLFDNVNQPFEDPVFNFFGVYFDDPTVYMLLPAYEEVPALPIVTHHEFQFQSAAAPLARPMSLADYPPFQELAPEVQALLLDYIQKTPRPAVIIPKQTALLPNYPNPFNPETWLPYQLSKPADVTLTIYDIQGRVVRALDLGHQSAGMYHSRSRAVHWDGKNAQGEAVASGLYFYTLKAGDFTATRKMLIRK